MKAHFALIAAAGKKYCHLVRPTVVMLRISKQELRRIVPNYNVPAPAASANATGTTIVPIYKLQLMAGHPGNLNQVVILRE